MEEIKCHTCDSLFIGRSNRKYCSNKCLNKYRNRPVKRKEYYQKRKLNDNIDYKKRKEKLIFLTKEWGLYTSTIIKYRIDFLEENPLVREALKAIQNISGRNSKHIEVDPEIVKLRRKEGRKQTANKCYHRNKERRKQSRKEYYQKNRLKILEQEKLRNEKRKELRDSLGMKEMEYRNYIKTNKK